MATADDLAPYLRSTEVLAALNLQMMAAVGRISADGIRRVDVVITSLDKGLVHRWWTDPTGWHPSWEPRGGTDSPMWASRATLVSPGDGLLLAVALDLQGNLAYSWPLQPINEAGPWAYSGLGSPPNDQLVSHPAAVVDGDRVRVYVRGKHHGLWALALDPRGGGVLEGWQVQKDGEGFPPPPPLVGAPAAASWTAGRVDLFGVSRDSRLLVHAWKLADVYAPSWDTPPHQFGLTSSPDAVATRSQHDDTEGVLRVVACGDSALEPAFARIDWLGRHWDSPGAIFRSDAVSDAALATWGLDNLGSRLDLFYVGVLSGGTFTGGPFTPVHLWSEDGGRTWNEDGDFGGLYPVQYFGPPPPL